MKYSERFESIENIRREIERTCPYYFSPDTMRFFRSRVDDTAYLSADGELAFFVTSEQFVASSGWRAPRAYSVRVFDRTTGDISTVGAFQAFPSLEQARRQAKAEAGLLRQPVTN